MVRISRTAWLALAGSLPVSLRAVVTQGSGSTLGLHNPQSQKVACDWVLESKECDACGTADSRPGLGLMCCQALLSSPGSQAGQRLTLEGDLTQQRSPRRTSAS